MASKKSLFFGAVLGGLATSATIYALKTENGKQIREKASDKLKDLVEVIEETIENREEVLGYVKAKAQDARENFRPHSQTHGIEVSPVYTIEKERINQELSKIRQEISNIETIL